MKQQTILEYLGLNSKPSISRSWCVIHLGNHASKVGLKSPLLDILRLLCSRLQYLKSPIDEFRMLWFEIVLCGRRSHWTMSHHHENSDLRMLCRCFYFEANYICQFSICCLINIQQELIDIKLSERKVKVCHVVCTTFGKINLQLQKAVVLTIPDELWPNKNWSCGI